MAAPCQTASPAFDRPRVVGFGVDTLWLFWRAPLSTVALERLSTLRDVGRGLPETEWPTVQLGGQRLVVRPHGSSSAGAALLLESEAMAVKLHPAPLAGMPTVAVELRSIFLWQAGADQAVAAAQRVVDELVPDGVILDPRSMVPHVTRVDLAVDFQGWSPTAEELMPPDDKNAPGLRCRAKRQTVELAAGTCSGATFGRHSSEVSGGIYDKTREIAESSGKDWFEEVWSASPDYVPGEDVWRLEYRLRREGVTSFEQGTGEHLVCRDGVERAQRRRVETWEEFKSALPGIWRYLTGEWLVWRGQRRKDTVQVIAEEWLVFHGLEHELLHQGERDVLRRRRASAPGVDVAVVRGHQARLLASVTYIAQAMGRRSPVTLEELLPWLQEEISLLDERKAKDGKPSLRARAAELVAAWRATELQQPDAGPGAHNELLAPEDLPRHYWQRAGADAYAARPRSTDELLARIELRLTHRKTWLDDERERERRDAEWSSSVAAQAG